MGEIMSVEYVMSVGLGYERGFDYECGVML